MNQIRRNGAGLALLYGFGAAVVAVVGVLGSRVPGGIGMVMRDPAQALDGPFYTGLISNLGVLFWCTAAAVCLFSWMVLRRRGGPADWSYFFGFAGVVTAILLLDDLFLIHDEVVPKWLFPRRGVLHLNEKVVLGVYALVAASFVWKCRETILRKTDWGLLALTVGLLALSVISERSFTKAFIPTKELRTLAEDGFKLLGIIGWCHYFVRTAVGVVAGSGDLGGPRARLAGAPEVESLRSR